MKITFTFTLVWICLCAGRVCAQQDPIYAQYQNNPLVINPAFTAINEKFNAGL